jgi:acyl-CoA synthetase (AMP-forming)/AMP-acid ligase II
MSKLNNDIEIKNLADRFFYWAKKKPNATAIRYQDHQGKESSSTFLELLQKVDSCRQHLRDNGFKPGQKILVLFPLSVEFIVFILAIIAEGLVPVLLDPRLSSKHWMASLKKSQIVAIFSFNKFFHLRWIQWTLFKYHLWSLDSSSFKVKSFKSFFEMSPENSFNKPTPTFKFKSEMDSMITLTSGTTGQPKVIHRKFGILKAQQDLSLHYIPKLNPDIHLPLYGVSVLVSILQGSETYIASNFEPGDLALQLETNQITRLSGPPGTIEKIAEELIIKNKVIPTVQNILIGGAPLPKWLIKKLKNPFPNATINIIYGSTECEPIASVNANYYLDTDLPGYCVGFPIQEISIHQSNPFLYNGQSIFEIDIEGPNVSIQENQKCHHTGDLGYFDSNNNLWLVGRKAEMIQHHPVGMIESKLEEFNLVKRAALVEKVKQIHCFIETENLSNLNLALKTEINSFLTQFDFKNVKIHFVEKIPVDPRHDWKIDRSKLKSLAA